MSFWNTSDNQALGNNGQFQMVEDIEPMPDGTQCKVYIDEAKWDEYDGNRYISLRWCVIEGEFKNRKVYQKVRVCEPDSKKRDKALRMLAAIDSNAGGNLQKLGTEPTDMDLAINLMNKPMAIMVKVWAIETETGETKKGNWVCAVSPVGGAVKQPAQQPAKAQDMADDIPF